MINVFFCGHALCMDTMGDRLKQARTEAGFTKRAAAAERAGVGYSTFSAHESGQNQIPAEMATEYGRVFGVSPSWLLFGEDENKSSHREVTLQQDTTAQLHAPIVGWVQAGAWQEPYDMDSDNNEFRIIKAHPRYPNAQYIVFDVRGDSFDKVAPEGSSVVVLPWAETGLLTPLHGQVIIAEQSKEPFEANGMPIDGSYHGAVQRTLKRVRIEGDKVCLDPDSTNSRYKPIVLDQQARAFGLVVSVIRDLEV